MPCDLARYSYAYFHNLPQADLPYIKIPLHTVIKLTPKAYGCDEERYYSQFAVFQTLNSGLDMHFQLEQLILIGQNQEHYQIVTWCNLVEILQESIFLVTSNQ